jgi:hypothetical protein
MNIRAFHADLRTRLAHERPDPLAALGRALVLGFVVFTFMAGLIFTVLPMAGMIWRHIVAHMIEPIARWIAAEPVFGQQFTMVAQISALAVLLYLLRNWLMLALTFVAAQAVKRFAQARAWIEGDGAKNQSPEPRVFSDGAARTFPVPHPEVANAEAAQAALANTAHGANRWPSRDTAVIGG